MFNNIRTPMKTQQFPVKTIYQDETAHQNLTDLLFSLKNLDSRTNALKNKLQNNKLLRVEYQYYQEFLRNISYDIRHTHIKNETVSRRSKSWKQTCQIDICRTTDSKTENLELHVRNHEGKENAYAVEKLPDELKNKIITNLSSQKQTNKKPASLIYDILNFCHHTISSKNAKEPSTLFEREIIQEFHNLEKEYNEITEALVLNKLATHESMNELYNAARNQANIFHPAIQKVFTIEENRLDGEIKKMNGAYDRRVHMYKAFYFPSGVLSIIGIGLLPLVITATIHLVDKLITKNKTNSLKQEKENTKVEAHKQIKDSIKENNKYMLFKTAQSIQSVKQTLNKTKIVTEEYRNNENDYNDFTKGPKLVN